jgi:predicted transcriptional regulator
MPGSPDVLVFTIRLPKELVDRLDELVKKRRKAFDLAFNRSRLIREALADFVKREELLS